MKDLREPKPDYSKLKWGEPAKPYPLTPRYPDVKPAKPYPSESSGLITDKMRDRVMEDLRDPINNMGEGERLIAEGAYKEHDEVNHPPHYKAGGIECIDYIEVKGFGYHLGNAVKYITRAGLKGNREKDIKKAVWYLNRYLEKFND